MSDLVDILRSLKRGPSSPQSAKGLDPTTSSSSLAVRRSFRGSLRPLHLSSSPTASKVQGNTSQQSSLSPDSPCQILVISPTASMLTVPDRGAEPTSPTPSTSSYRRRLLSRCPRQLPPIPESGLPSFGRTGTGWHHPSSPRARANPNPHPESYGYMCRETSTGRSSESLICTRDLRREYTNPPAPPTRRLLAEKERFEYDTPPPYQTLDCLDNDMVWTSKGFEDKHKHYYYSKQVGAYRAEPPLLSFLDMD